jgi:hypothetical protein
MHALSSPDHDTCRMKQMCDYRIGTYARVYLERFPSQWVCQDLQEWRPNLIVLRLGRTTADRLLAREDSAL